MNSSPIRNKSYELAVQTVDIADYLSELKQYTLARQILRSGTSVGAMVWESKYAESKKDFIHKLSVALKEANETSFWISLLYDSKKIDYKCFGRYNDLLSENIKLLNKILITSKKNQINGDNNFSSFS